MREPGKSQKAAFEELKKSAPNAVIRWDKNLGVPTRLRGNLSAPQYGDPATIALQFLVKNKELYGLKEPAQELQLKGVEEYTLSIFDKKDEEAQSYPAVSSANAYPFMLGQWQVNNIMKKPEELLKTQTAPAPENG